MHLTCISIENIESGIEVNNCHCACEICRIILMEWPSQGELLFSSDSDFRFHALPQKKKGVRETLTPRLTLHLFPKVLISV